MYVPLFNGEARDTMHVRLREKGLTVETWARGRGISEGVASKIVSRYVGKARRPSGRRGIEVIEGLEKATGLVLCGKGATMERRAARARKAAGKAVSDQEGYGEGA
jgi:hypothetical protein